MPDKIKPIIAYHTAPDTSHGAGLCFVGSPDLAHVEARAARKKWLAEAPRFRVQITDPQGQETFSWHLTREAAGRVADASRGAFPHGNRVSVRELNDKELLADQVNHSLSLAGRTLTVEIAAEDNAFIDWNRRQRSERMKTLLTINGVNAEYEGNLSNPTAPASTKGNGEGKHIYAFLAHFYGRESTRLFSRQRDALLEGEGASRSAQVQEQARELTRLINDPVTTGERLASEYLADGYVAGIRYEIEPAAGESSRRNTTHYTVFLPSLVTVTHCDGTALAPEDARKMLAQMVEEAKLTGGPIFSLLPTAASVEASSASPMLRGDEQEAKIYLSPSEGMEPAQSAEMTL